MLNKHRYDIKNRPESTELAEHLYLGHAEDDLEVSILQTGKRKKLIEDKRICRLQTGSPTGINKIVKQYAKNMYTLFKKTFNPTTFSSPLSPLHSLSHSFHHLHSPFIWRHDFNALLLPSHFICFLTFLSSFVLENDSTTAETLKSGIFLCPFSTKSTNLSQETK